MHAQNKGIAGIVVDGAIRDCDSLAELDIPVYAAAVTPQGPLKNGYGEINVPVACGGQVVFPGDILVGDGDGICVIHAKEAATIIDEVKKKVDGEKKILDRYHTVGNDTESHLKKYGAIVESNHTQIYDEKF